MSVCSAAEICVWSYSWRNFIAKNLLFAHRFRNFVEFYTVPTSRVCVANRHLEANEIT